MRNVDLKFVCKIALILFIIATPITRCIKHRDMNHKIDELSLCCDSLQTFADIRYEQVKDIQGDVVKMQTETLVMKEYLDNHSLK